MLAEDWDLAIGVTPLPIMLGRRAVAAHASPTHGAAVLSLPALGPGAGRRAAELVRRLVDALPSGSSATASNRRV
jgi:hypothetical protein